MTLTEMLTLLDRQLAYDLDNSAAAAGVTSASDATDQINFGIRAVSRYIRQYDPLITLTLVAGTKNYNIRNDTTPVVSKKVIEVKRVIINGNPIIAASRQRPGLWTQQEIERDNRTWITDTSTGIPTKACQIADRLWLHVTPSAACVAAGQNYVAGLYMAANLDSVSDLNTIPDIPEETHEAAVRIAADFAADPNVTEAEGIARLQRFMAKAYDDLTDVRKRNLRNAQSWGSTNGSEGSDYLRL